MGRGKARVGGQHNLSMQRQRDLERLKEIRRAQHEKIEKAKAWLLQRRVPSVLSSLSASSSLPPIPGSSLNPHPRGSSPLPSPITPLSSGPEAHKSPKIGISSTRTSSPLPALPASAAFSEKKVEHTRDDIQLLVTEALAAIKAAMKSKSTQVEEGDLIAGVETCMVESEDQAKIACLSVPPMASTASPSGQEHCLREQGHDHEVKQHLGGQSQPQEEQHPHQQLEHGQWQGNSPFLPAASDSECLEAAPPEAEQDASRADEANTACKEDISSASIDQNRENASSSSSSSLPLPVPVNSLTEAPRQDRLRESSTDQDFQLKERQHLSRRRMTALSRHLEARNFVRSFIAEIQENVLASMQDEGFFALPATAVSSDPGPFSMVAGPWFPVQKIAGATDAQGARQEQAQVDPDDAQGTRQEQAQVDPDDAQGTRQEQAQSEANLPADLASRVHEAAIQEEEEDLFDLGPKNQQRAGHEEKQPSDHKAILSGLGDVSSGQTKNESGEVSEPDARQVEREVQEAIERSSAVAVGCSTPAGSQEDVERRVSGEKKRNGSGMTVQLLEEDVCSIPRVIQEEVLPNLLAEVENNVTTREDPVDEGPTTPRSVPMEAGPDVGRQESFEDTEEGGMEEGTGEEERDEARSLQDIDTRSAAEQALSPTPGISDSRS
ncbi:hypothetical protein NSK_004079 [Nannochloropsis salina CCMP1776]|jgi:hypothetical protein|uniref:Uncharacterized protein n=1 Tax=Nannochloropsis salina CCMP1776 TaxID=1027361 RepID=A0A4D9D118_9STRA|nr:hypothetical protein NSK_004079 [Nannochloropsis salina CCMP1776]|eukprot:TFJ84614.1 hypothetical protein NSK_004079 [Nannochloropsis salina CCMP1776]